MSAKELLLDPKLGQAVATSTIGSGVATILEWIPTDIGKLATLVGIVLSSVLIYTHIQRYRGDSEKTRLETEVLRKQLRGELPPPPIG